MSREWTYESHEPFLGRKKTSSFLIWESEISSPELKRYWNRSVICIKWPLSFRSAIKRIFCARFYKSPEAKSHSFSPFVFLPGCSTTSRLREWTFFPPFEPTQQSSSENHLINTFEQSLGRKRIHKITQLLNSIINAEEAREEKTLIQILG